MIPRVETLRGWACAAAVITVPCMLWLTSGALEIGEGWFLAYTIGQFLGVLGFSLFSLALFISMRIPLFEIIFGDLASAYRVHQFVGGLSVIAIVLHPVLLTLPLAMISKEAALEFWFPPLLENIPQWLGISGLVVFVAAMICTFFVKLPYQLWKKTHRYLGLAFVLGAAHALYIDGAIQTAPLVKAVFVLFTLTGIAAICYRILFKRWFVRRMPYELVRATSLDGFATRLTLKPLGAPMKFRAGQFAYLNIRDPRINDEFSFSICSPEDSDTLDFTARAASGARRHLPELSPGTRVDLEGPYGRFSYRFGGKRQLWIAGGIGVTPFLSLTPSLPAGYDVDLIYSVNKKEEAVVYRELLSRVPKDGQLRLHLWVSDERGRISPDGLRKQGIAFGADTDLFLSGPPGMVSGLQQAFVAAGINPARVRTELFAMKPDQGGALRHGVLAAFTAAGLYLLWLVTGKWFTERTT